MRSRSAGLAGLQIPSQVEEVGREPAVSGRGDIERLEQDGPRPEQESHPRERPQPGQRRAFQRLHVHARKRRDHLGTLRVEMLRVEDRGAEEVERDRRHGEDDHAEPGVELHDADPAPRPGAQAGVSVRAPA